MTALLLLSLLLLILVGVPIATALGFSSLAYFVVRGGIPLEAISQRMLKGVDSFPLLAVPLFIMAGCLMNTSGITRRIFHFARTVVGHIPGGLGHVNILASVIFAGMSGAAVADAAGLGKIEIEAMTNDGYDPDFSAAITAASSTISPIIPPSIAAVIYAVATGQSVGAMFMGGVIPGLLMALSMMVVTVVISNKRNYPRYERSSFGEIWAALKESFLPLLMPLIILVGIYGGVFTPTEAAVIAVVYALFIGGIVYRELSLSDLRNVVIETIQSTAMVMYIIATASVFSWILIYEQVPALVADFVLSLTNNPHVVMLLLIAAFLVLGTFMESIAIIMLTIPVVFPVITRLNIDPVHFGIVMLVSLMIGLVTPPVGVCLFAVCEVAKVTIGDVTKELLPFYVALLVAVLLIAFFPGLVLTLPRLMMKG
ncbi:MAG: TRAP transporter large permease [Firmicutes bacterium]|jgi:C4-dicarboxylate transporter DctM subunit|nr:TRAP transporter large permease [Bacillota bacterium]